MTSIEFEDPEVWMGKADEKINYQLILFKQIDVIREARSEIIIDNKINDVKYINSVKSLRLLLITYLDDKYRENMKKSKINLNNVKNRIDYYDKMFEELLFVCERKKLIGGDLLLN